MRGKEKYIVVIFSLIIFAMSICITISKLELENIKNKNGLFLGDTINFNFEGEKIIKFKEVIEVAEKYNDVYIEFNPVPVVRTIDTVFGKAIYHNYPIAKNNLDVQGSDLSIDEIVNGKNTILVGTKVKDSIYEKNGIEYFDVEGKPFEVSGIIGNGTSAYDEMFIISMKALPEYESDSRGQWKIGASEETTKNIINDLEKKYNTKVVEKAEIYEDDEIKDVVQPFMKILYTVGIIGVLNICIVGVIWLSELSVEISIRKALGAKNLDIIKFIILKNLKLSIVSMGLAVLIQMLLKNELNKMFSRFAFDINLEVIGLLTIVVLSISLILSVIPCVKAVRREASIGMKGGD
ncbi:MAG: FtsX-like permease family protein [Clostridium sp.]|uniref:FtsX-like permease family protein n=1 Tax=Clostridium sp. TaxID=1506 RepID=UPI003F39E248